MEKTMDKAFKSRSAAPSRRSILRKAVLTTGTAMLGATLIADRTATAQTKVAQSVVGYQDMPHDGQRCDNCLQFQPPDACKVVEGKISPSGWCKIYAKKPA
jgi:High potential iron-sulfur protein